MLVIFFSKCQCDSPQNSSIIIAVQLIMATGNVIGSKIFTWRIVRLAVVQLDTLHLTFSIAVAGDRRSLFESPWYFDDEFCRGLWGTAGDQSKVHKYRIIRRSNLFHTIQAWRWRERNVADKQIEEKTVGLEIEGKRTMKNRNKNLMLITAEERKIND